MTAILTYHSIDGSGSVVSISPELFARQMALLAASGAKVVDLPQCLGAANAVALTFDDGYRNFLRHAAPVLARYNFPATVFVVSGKAGGSNDWDAADARFPRHELMNWDEIGETARAGFSIGAHSVSHADLSRLPADAAIDEMMRSADDIAQRMGRPVRTFAYPYGRSTPEVRQAAGRRFDACCGTRLGYLRADSEPANLPRLDAYYLRNEAIFAHLMSPAGAAWIALRAALRALRHRPE